MKFNHYPFQQYKDLPDTTLNSTVDENGNIVLPDDTPKYGNVDENGKLQLETLGPSSGDSVVNQLSANTPGTEEINTELTNSVKAPIKAPGSGFGSKAMGAAPDILNAGMQQIGNFSTRSTNAGERKAQTIQGVASGAKLGMQVAGPWGAAAGAIVGGGLAAIDNKADKDFAADKADSDYRDKNTDIKNDRAQFYDGVKSAQEKKLKLGFSQRFNQNKIGMS